MALVVLGIGCVGVLTVGLLRRVRRAPAASWACTRGTVLSSTVQVTNGNRSRHEKPLVLYRYQVAGSEFQGNRVRLRRVTDPATQVVDRYPAGARVEVFYDPANPAASVLEP